MLPPFMRAALPLSLSLRHKPLLEERPGVLFPRLAACAAGRSAAFSVGLGEQVSALYWQNYKVQTRSESLGPDLCGLFVCC